MSNLRFFMLRMPSFCKSMSMFDEWNASWKIELIRLTHNLNRFITDQIWSDHITIEKGIHALCFYFFQSFDFIKERRQNINVLIEWTFFLNSSIELITSEVWLIVEIAHAHILYKWCLGFCFFSPASLRHIVFSPSSNEWK